MLEVEINSDKTDGKLLLIAAASGKRSTVKLCLNSRKFDINARDHFGLSPLLLAAQSLYDDSDILQLLLDMDTVEIGARDYEHKRTALLWAADAGSVKKFTTLLQTGKFDINERDVNGMTPFILAVQQYRSDIVEFLLNAEGVDLYTRDHKHKRTALMWAAYAGQAKVFLTLLRAGKFDINETDAHGLTPFLIAAKKGKADIVRILLDTDGVDLYRRDSKYGRTAMMWAASVMNPAPFFLLLHSGKFDLKEKGLDGLDSTEIAIKRKNSVHVSLLKMDQDQINNWYTITCNNIMRPVTD
ncbi:uncharacterized protein TRIVIDRAFT_163799 [Trichoderma virens Gv29-8]|uniref:Uncharacterized protein n=1 Tax=Hypocrea virens (strain Gv29-8 / FGSC 10586) TaxID=413071 RepID=G9NBF4_HYPVG|nr:uncharacterized protein TRIVIDRAFT_163799 [Trichoderma virens Gv29-8]EHK16159.1 hypothetical protein TRIVIDRAFT_163799 [Trichoderma virens Gv29-8]